MTRYAYWPVTAASLLLATASLQCAKTQTIRPVNADITVAADGSTEYESIGDALDDAEDGCVILVKPGMYEEDVEFPDDVSRISLIGAGPDKTIIDADGEYSAVKLQGNGHRLSGFTLRGGKSHGVYVSDGNHQVDHCLIAANGDRGVYLSTMSGHGSARIDHCTIVGNRASGIYSVKDDEQTSVTNCIIAFNGRGIVSDKNESGMKIEYNCLHDDGSEFEEVTEGQGNIDEDPLFVNRDEDNYRLAPTSPCRKAASDGANMGCF